MLHRFLVGVSLYRSMSVKFSRTFRGNSRFHTFESLQITYLSKFRSLITFQEDRADILFTDTEYIV